MKKIFSIVILLLVFFSCKKEDLIVEEKNQESSTQFNIIEDYCGTINYVNKIGTDYQTAEDSLFKMIILPNSGCPNNPCQEFHVFRDTTLVDFKNDNRTFITLVFKDIEDKQNLMSPTYVIDDRGNYYQIHWCED